MRVVVLLLISLLIPAAGEAQTPSTALALTLDDAVARGLAWSRRLAEAGARHDAAAAAVGSRTAAMRPQVAALGGYMRTNHIDEFGILLPDNQLRVIYPDVPDNYRARVDVQWPVYTGGKLARLAEAAQTESSATAKDLEALTSDVRLDIARAFWALVVADESLRVVNESLGRTAAHLRDVRNRLDAGLVPPSDVLMVQAQESRQRMLSIQARSSRDVAEAELARIIGVAPGTAIQPNAVLEPAGVEMSFDSLLGQALSVRKDRQAIADRLAGAGLRLQAAESGKRPTVAIGGGVDYARPNPRIFPRTSAWNESWDASINVSWPLFDGGRTRAEVAEAAAAHRVLQARAEELDSMVSLEIRQRIAEIQSSRAAIAAANDALEAATEARRVVGERFDAGVATSTDLVDAQLAVLQAALDRTQALANAKLADARLQRALGQ